MPSAAAAGMTPIRDSARARAASTSSIACTQARSDTVTSIKSVLRLGPKSASDGKEDRLPFALQPDVEVEHAPAILRDQRLATRRLNEVQNRIGGVGLRLIRKIHPRHQVTEQTPGENRDVEVGRLRAPVRRRRSAGLGGREAECALSVGAGASESGAYLPDLNQGVGDGLTLPVEDLALHPDRAGGARRQDLLTLLERQSDAEERTDRLRRRQRPAQGSFSKGVAARPRSTMSH